MEFAFESKVILTLDHKEGTEISTHVSTEFGLEVLGNLDPDVYLEKDSNMPNKEGSRVLSNVLVAGLVGNIHMAHENGFRDSAEHLRWIIAELERGFITVANISESTYSR